MNFIRLYSGNFYFLNKSFEILQFILLVINAKFQLSIFKIMQTGPLGHEVYYYSYNYTIVGLTHTCHSYSTGIHHLNMITFSFSHSFEIIEEKSEMIWRYNLYDLVHEYYHLTFLPPPANLIIHAYLSLKWIINRLRYLSFKGKSYVV